MELLTFTEAPARANVSEQTIRRRVRDGSFEEVMDGTRPKIRLEDLQKLYPSAKGRQQRECRILAFANQKGGVGKTTTCANLAAVFAKTHRVLCIDCDPQGNLAQAFGLNPDDITVTTFNVITGEVPLSKAILQPLEELPALHLVAANLDLADAEVKLMSVMAGEFMLRRAIEPIKHLYEFILIDAPPSLGVLAMNSLSAATDIIIPVNVGTFSLRGVQKLLGFIESVREFNTDLKRIRPVANEVDNTNLAKDLAVALETAFKDDLFITRIRKSQPVKDDQAQGVPVTLNRPRADVSLDYAQLAREILGEPLNQMEDAHGE